MIRSIMGYSLSQSFTIDYYKQNVDNRTVFLLCCMTVASSLLCILVLNCSRWIKPYYLIKPRRESLTTWSRKEVSFVMCEDSRARRSNLLVFCERALGLNMTIFFSLTMSSIPEQDEFELLP